MSQEQISTSFCGSFRRLGWVKTDWGEGLGAKIPVIFWLYDGGDASFFVQTATSNFVQEYVPCLWPAKKPGLLNGHTQVDCTNLWFVAWIHPWFKWAQFKLDQLRTVVSDCREEETMDLVRPVQLPIKPTSDLQYFRYREHFQVFINGQRSNSIWFWRF